MPIEKTNFETYESLILSEQVPHEDVPALLDRNPDFAAWYRGRMTTRTIPSTTPRS